jgi:hypothetical protein
MNILDTILAELDEWHILEHITKKHDEARLQYHTRSNTVSTDAEFDDVIADYYNHHFARCISSSGLSRAEAAGRAKEIIESGYRRKKEDMLTAYSDGKHGYNGGMRAILDMIAEALKEEAIERHIRDVLDRYVAPTGFEEQVAIVRAIIAKTQISSRYVDPSRPERYARNYEELIRGLVEAIRLQADKFRRL